MTATSFEALLGPTRVVPVITIKDAELAVPLAEALVAGGLQVLEVTLRTEAGLESISRIAAEVSGVVVGAGTVVTPQQLLDARNAGSQFIVSPGCTESLAAAAADAGGVFLPGAVTASEVLRLLELGISMMKFFPAETSGGIAALKALGAPFPQVRFCPTGGIGLERAPSYLALGNVVCIGGSWMVPAELIEQHAWAAITALAAEATSATRLPATATL
jgi:2-dehydro-3-deoxyphosphogluconate aldolase/(4S)-4-hydroxy-2-oxoglutarate aldolase